MKSKICLIRHGTTRGNSEDMYYGNTDIPLQDEGRDKLIELAAEGIYPYSENADYYTTGMIRTEQTLELIYGKRPHEKLELLRELNFGEYEMKTHAQLKSSEEYNTWRHDTTGELVPPGGESINTFAARILEGYAHLRNRHALKELSMRHSGKEAVSIVICHGGSIAAILYDIFPEEAQGNFYYWIPEPGHGYVLQLEDESVVGIEKF